MIPSTAFAISNPRLPWSPVFIADGRTGPKPSCRDSSPARRRDRGDLVGREAGKERLAHEPNLPHGRRDTDRKALDAFDHLVGNRRTRPIAREGRMDQVVNDWLPARR